MIAMEPCQRACEAVNMATGKSDWTVLQVPRDGKEVPTYVAGSPTKWNLLEVDEDIVDTGNKTPDIRQLWVRIHT